MYVTARSGKEQNIADTKRSATLTRKHMEFPTEWTIVPADKDLNSQDGAPAEKEAGDSDGAKGRSER